MNEQETVPEEKTEQPQPVQEDRRKLQAANTPENLQKEQSQESPSDLNPSMEATGRPEQEEKKAQDEPNEDNNFEEVEEPEEKEKPGEEPETEKGDDEPELDDDDDEQPEEEAPPSAVELLALLVDKISHNPLTAGLWRSTISEEFLEQIESAIKPGKEKE